MDLPLELLRLSLSQRQAKRRLIDSFAERLQLERRPLILGELLFRILEPDTLVTGALGALLVLAGAAGLAPLWDAALGGILLTIALCNAWITSRETRLAAGELKSRMQVWLRNVSRDHHIHRSAPDGPGTVSIMRDGVWLRLHRNLGVEGDVVKLRAGEAAPGHCSQPAHLTAMCGVQGQSLLPGDIFVPAALPASSRGVSSTLADDVRSTFVLSETIAVRQLDHALRRKRAPPPPLEVQISAVRRLLLWAVLASWAQAALLQGIGWFLAAGERPASWEELRAWLGAFFLPHLASLAIPLLPLALPAFLALANALGAAYLLITLTGMPARQGSDQGLPRGLTRGGSASSAKSGWRSDRVPGLAHARDHGAWPLCAWVGGWFGGGDEDGYWDASAYYEGQAEEGQAPGSAGHGPPKIARRGPERLFSDAGAPGFVTGRRFMRYAGARLSYEQWEYLTGLTWRVLRGEPQQGQLRPSRLLSTLGSTTVLACPDKRGVLSDGTLSIKQLAFFQLDHSGSPKLTTLDMSKHPAYRFLTRFDEPTWRSHLSVLKPLGLNAVLNSTCRHVDCGAAMGETLRAQLLQGREARVAAELLHSSAADGAPLHPCLCLLGRAVGFSDDVLRRFKKVAEIHLVGSKAPEAAPPAGAAPPAARGGGGTGGGGSWAAGAVPGRREVASQLPLLMAVVVEDERGKLQVFSRGQPAMVLARCTSFWDGDSIRALAEEERKQLLACNASMAGNRCLEAIAFSYAPVPDEMAALFRFDEPLQTVILHDLPEGGAEAQAGGGGGVEAEGSETEGGYFAGQGGDAESLGGGAAVGDREPPPRARGAGEEGAAKLSRSVSDHLLDSCEQRGVTFAPGTWQLARGDPAGQEVPAARLGSPRDLPSRVVADDAARARSQNSSPSPMRGGGAALPYSASAGAGLDARSTRAAAAKRGASSEASRRQAALRELLGRHVFCGLAGTVDRARVEAPDVVEDAFNAGIRFVYLSRDNERRTKAFGHELGLETDWNSCIDLADEPPHPSAAPSPTMGGVITKLPRGIEAVRPHLRDVDNVPLLVSMFCNCRARPVREMAQIYQESCELVCVVGSADASHSAAVFSQADVAVAVQPLDARRCRWIGLEAEPAVAALPRLQPRLPEAQRAPGLRPGAAARAGYAEPAAGGAGPGGAPEGELSVAGQLDSACCVAVLPECHDLEQLTEWLLQGRSLLHNMRQALLFTAFAALLLELLLVVADWAGLPPPQTPFQLLWLTLLVVPLLGFPLLLGPVDPRDKKQMAPKNEEHMLGLSRGVLGLLVRALPGAACLGPLFAIFLAMPSAASAPPAADWPPPEEGAGLDPLSLLLGGGAAASEAGAGPQRLLLGSLVQRPHASDEVVLHAQLLLQWWLTVLLIAHSASFAHRTLDESSYPPAANHLWVRAGALAFGLQNVAILVQLGPTHIPQLLGQIPWYAHLVGAGMVLLASIVDWLVKRHDRRSFERWNKMMYLEFTTKLGMHSPIEPGHLAPRSYLDE